MRPASKANFSRPILLSLLILGQLACLLPPTNNNPRYLESKEFKELSEVTEAKNLTQSGRLDAAELLYRNIIKKSPQLLIPQNDLAYILILEGRLSEAQDLLESLIQRDTRFIPARLNLARLYVANENFDAAIKEYSEVLLIYENYTKQELALIAGERINSSLPVDILRLKASAYYLKGEYDNAICYSELAMSARQSIDEASLHSRLLFSVEEVQKGLQIIRALVASNPEGMPNSVNFDFALGLAANNEFADAARILDRVLEKGNLSTRQLAAAKFLRLAVEDKDAESLILKENFSETTKNDCKIEDFDVDHYWPYNASELIKKSQKELCSING